MVRGIFTEELFLLEKEPVGTEVELTAEFARYLYESEDSHFFVGLFITDNYDEFVVTGNVPFQLAPRRSYTLTGEVSERENTYTEVVERQLKLRKIVTVKPKGEAQVIKFLSEITGTVIASYIYDKYGEDTLQVIKADPERVHKDFRGVSLKAAHQLQEDVLEALAEISEAFPFLQGYGFSVNEIEKMVDRYGEEIKPAVEKNPFILMNDQDGYPGASFAQCDKIARDVKFDMRNPRRIQAGIEYALMKQGNFGHIYFYLEDVIKQSLAVLNSKTSSHVKKNDVEKNIEEMILANKLMFDGAHGTLYLKRYYLYEKDLAFNLVALQNADEWFDVPTRESILDDMLREKKIELETKQREAVLAFSRSRSGVGVLNGGAGTGKTFTLNIYLEMMNRLYRKEQGRLPYIQLMAPTGKAAKVMRGATGMTATTIHRALGWTDEGFVFNPANPLSADIVVVDEASMLDTFMAYSLVRALKMGTKLIFLGDPNQLPSIGAGNVLHDIVDSGRFEAITLNVTKRQAGNSQVAINGQRITEQKAPERDANKEDPKAITKTPQTTMGLVHQTIKALHYLLSKGIQSDDIQIITAGRKGMTGMYHLNHKVQTILNPSSGGKEVLNRRFTVDGRQLELMFRVRDRVIHTSNTDKLQWVKEVGPQNYESTFGSSESKIITNGEIGIIHDIYTETYETRSGRSQNRDILIVRYDDGLVRYTTEDKKDLDHAYAMTIHKSQGSQWQAVIEIMSSEHQMLLDNSLLYTGYTRAEDIQILLAEQQALSKALHTRKTFDRRTTLKRWIQEEKI